MSSSVSTCPAEPKVSGADERLNGLPLTRTMVPNAYGVIWYTPHDDCYWADESACQILRIPAEGCGAQNWMRELNLRIEPDAGGQKRYHTFRNHEGNVVRARLVPSRGPERVILIDDLKDIANRVSQLRQKEREYRELFENASYGIHRLSIDGRQLHANPALVRLNGYEAEDDMLAAMAGTPHLDYVEAVRASAFVEEIRSSGKVADFVSEVYRHKTRERIWVSENAWLVTDEAGMPSYIAGTVVEITERMRYLERMKVAAETDSLTGLANRTVFSAELQRRINSSESMVLTVFLVDFDRFKDINDVFGHARGDTVLRICARRLEAALPAGARLARLGGDEFAILSCTCGDGASALDLARRLAAVVDAPIDVDGASHLLGASIGIAQYPTHADNGVDLMRNADLALYSVKDGGRGHARLFDADLDRAKRRRHEIERDLRDAHRRGELELHYQPMVDGRSCRTVSLEALCRWRHPRRGLVDPSEFVAVAEDTGLMLAFGEWIISEACRHAAALPEAMTVAVNVSALQFRSQGLAGIVAAALAGNRLPPERLEIEITESLVLKNEAATFAVFNELRALGVRIALDDFGAGYSTLSSLQRFAFDKVKIDRSFVDSLKSSAVNRAIARAVISIGRDLDIEVVAEGIETEAERQALLAEGCHLHQGFFYGRPKPFAEAAADLLVKSLSEMAPGAADAGGRDRRTSA